MRKQPAGVRKAVTPRNVARESASRGKPGTSQLMSAIPKSARPSLTGARTGAVNAAAARSPIVKDAPIGPEEAKEKYGALLNSYEMEEIMQYPEIYYVGSLSKKVKLNNSPAANYGFDLSNHHYRANTGDHIAYRYEIRSILGKGAFGQVLRCFDHKTKEQVALKIIVNAKEIEKQAKAETEILRLLNEDDKDGSSHIVKIIDSFMFRTHVCAIFEVLGQNLYEFSKANMFRPFPMRHVKVIMKQVLIALSFIHKHGIVHCDMKPENVLLVPGSNTQVRVIDLGSACRVGQKHFDYIQSRFYRAPEVMLGIKYGPPMDIWSVGCIIGEMVSGRPIFCGDSEGHQMQILISALGMPPAELIAAAPRKSTFFDADGNPKAVGKRKKLPPTTLAKVVRSNDHDLLDLLTKCFIWDQHKRITADEALRHPFFEIKETSEQKITLRPATANNHGAPGKRPAVVLKRV